MFIFYLFICLFFVLSCYAMLPQNSYDVGYYIKVNMILISLKEYRCKMSDIYFNKYFCWQSETRTEEAHLMGLPMFCAASEPSKSVRPL